MIFETEDPPREETARDTILRLRRAIPSQRLTWVQKHLKYQDYPEMYTIPGACFSDYSGDMADRSNSAYLLKTFPKFVTTEIGGHGTIWTGVKPDALRIPSHDEFESFKDLIDDLKKHGVLDEDLMSEMEFQEYDRYWKEDGAKELRSSLKDLIDSLDARVALTVMTDDDLYSIFRELDDGDAMHIEQGGSAYFDSDKIAEKIANNPDILTEYLPAGLVEKFQKIAWASGLEARFLDTIVQMYTRSNPSIASAVAQLSSNEGFALLLRLMPRADVAWTVNLSGKAAPEPPAELSLSDQDLIDVASVLKPEYLRGLRPEVGQGKFTFAADSIVNHLI